MVLDMPTSDEIGAVELLALYGEDDERLGRFLPGLKKFAKKAARFTPQYWAAKGIKAGVKVAKKGAKYTPHYWAARGVKKLFSGEEGAIEEVLGAYTSGQLSGEDMEYLGAFLPGLKKFAKKVGKVTSKITTAAARFVGVPQSAINALAKIDPTKRGTVVEKAIAAVKEMPSIATATLPAQQVVPVPATTMGFNTKKMLIIGGAGVGGLVLIGILAGAMRRRA
jgi:hypothetical protein